MYVCIICHVRQALSSMPMPTAQQCHTYNAKCCSRLFKRDTNQSRADCFCFPPHAAKMYVCLVCLGACLCLAGCMWLSCLFGCMPAGLLRCLLGICSGEACSLLCSVSSAAVTAVKILNLGLGCTLLRFRFVCRDG